jgi:hypothetical protein
MASNNKSSRLPPQGESWVPLIGAITDAVTKLITIGVITILVLGILGILVLIILQANSEVQQQIVPLLTGILGVIIGRMLAQGGTLPPEPPSTPDLSE